MAFLLAKNERKLNDVILIDLIELTVHEERRYSMSAFVEKPLNKGLNASPLTHVNHNWLLKFTFSLIRRFEQNNEYKKIPYPIIKLRLVKFNPNIFSYVVNSVHGYFRPSHKPDLFKWLTFIPSLRGLVTEPDMESRGNNGKITYVVPLNIILSNMAPQIS